MDLRSKHIQHQSKRIPFHHLADPNTHWHADIMIPILKSQVGFTIRFAVCVRFKCFFPHPVFYFLFLFLRCLLAKQRKPSCHSDLAEMQQWNGGFKSRGEDWKRVDFIVQYLCLVCWISLLLLLSLWVCLTAPCHKEQCEEGVWEKERCVTLAKSGHLDDIVMVVIYGIIKLWLKERDIQTQVGDCPPWQHTDIDHIYH